MRNVIAEARQEVSRQQILHAAKELFAVQGVRSTSLAQIAEALGMTKAALYHYFDSKQEIAVQAVLANLAEFTADVMVPLPEGVSAVERFRARIERKIERAERHGPLDLRFFYTVMLEELDEPAVEDVYREWWERGRQEVTAMIERGQAEGVFRRDADVDTLVNVLASTSMGIDLLWLNDPDRVDYAATHRLAIESLLRTLVTSEAGI
jgi:AcrR family transcriptional regulator